MFSSNPFSQLRSSTNGFFPPNSFFYHEKDDVHYNSLIISDDFHFHAYNTSAPPPVLENVATIHQDFVREQQISENHADVLDSVISGYKKRMATSKKDRRSKIYTARGPRDRRVRLSIDIARKFFCLQELLGFDKASETLDWLLSKSLTAIKELVEEKSHASSSTVTDQSKATFLETIYNGGSVEDNAEKNKSVSKCVNGKKWKTRPRCKSGFQENFVREQLRADARARARERTREKLRVKNLDDDLKTLVPNGCESGFWGQNERPYI